MTQRRFTIIHRVSPNGDQDELGWETEDTFTRHELIGILNCVMQMVIDDEGQPGPKEHQHCVVTEEVCALDYSRDDHDLYCCDCSEKL